MFHNQFDPTKLQSVTMVTPKVEFKYRFMRALPLILFVVALVALIVSLRGATPAAVVDALGSTPNRDRSFQGGSTQNTVPAYGAFYVGNQGMGEGVDRADACRTFHVFGHQVEQTGETDAIACGFANLVQDTGATPTPRVHDHKPTEVIATSTVTSTPPVVSTPTASPTVTFEPTASPTIVVTEVTPTVNPTQPPATETPVVTDEPTLSPTDVATETPKPHCDNGAGNGDDCTPGQSSGSNQGQGVPTGDQTNQGENGHRNTQ